MQNAGTTGRPLNFLSLASKAGKQGCGCTSTHSRVGDDPGAQDELSDIHRPTAPATLSCVSVPMSSPDIVSIGSPTLDLFCQSFTIRFRSHSI